MGIENLKKKKKEFPDIFSEALRKCTKTKMKIRIKENTMPFFKPKSVPYAAMDSINLELNWNE